MTGERKGYSRSMVNVFYCKYFPASLWSVVLQEKGYERKEKEEIMQTSGGAEHTQQGKDYFNCFPSCIFSIIYLQGKRKRGKGKRKKKQRERGKKSSGKTGTEGGREVGKVDACRRGEEGRGRMLPEQFLLNTQGKKCLRQPKKQIQQNAGTNAATSCTHTCTKLW